MQHRTYFSRRTIGAHVMAALMGAVVGCADGSAQQTGAEWLADHGEERDHHDDEHEHPVPTLTRVSTIEGLAAPESAYFDAKSKSWYVSNGGASGTTGDGFIAKLDARGALVTRQFITGLDDPRGQ